MNRITVNQTIRLVALAAALAVHPDWPGTGSAADRLGADVALIRLAQPLDPAAAEPFALGRPPLPGDPVTLISYRRDRAHALTRQDDCQYRAVVQRLLTLDCAVTYGASGAPVFAEIDGEMRVVAVLSAMRSTGTPRAYAARADASIDLLLSLLP